MPGIEVEARRLVRNGATLAQEDLEQVGIAEVLRVRDRWDPSRTKATTYFRWPIRRAMIDALRNDKMQGTRRDNTIWKPVDFTTYTAGLPSGDAREAIESLAPDELAEEDLRLYEGALYLEELFERLEPTKRTVMTAYYLRGKTMRDAGRLVGLSESRVSRLHTQILGEMRQWSEFRSEGNE